MRYVTIPEDVILEHLFDEKKQHPTMSFSSFVRKGLVADKRVNDSAANLDKFMEIEEALRTAKPGDTWPLVDEVWEFLALLVRTFDYDPNLKLYLLPFIKAVIGAQYKVTEKPSAEARPETV